MWGRPPRPSLRAQREAQSPKKRWLRDQLGFFAALVIPVGTWYILPIRATNNQPVIVLSPHLTKSKYGQYQEAWHLLISEPRPPAPS